MKYIPGITVNITTLRLKAKEIGYKIKTKTISFEDLARGGAIFWEFLPIEYPETQKMKEARYALNREVSKQCV